LNPRTALFRIELIPQGWAHANRTNQRLEMVRREKRHRISREYVKKIHSLIDEFCKKCEIQKEEYPNFVLFFEAQNDYGQDILFPIGFFPNRDFLNRVVDQIEHFTKEA
jgi:hypothetical protein